MNSTCLPNSLMSQPLLPPATGVPPQAAAAAAAAAAASAASSQSTSSTMDPSELSVRPEVKPENGGLRINYEGRVSVLHGPIYGGGTGDVSTTLDDSREERGGGWTSTDEQMSPKEQSSSPDALPKSGRSDDEEQQRPLERLREICNKSLPQHGSTMMDTAANETLQPDGSTLFHCHLCSYTTGSRDEFNDHVNDHYEFRCPKCDFDTKSEPEYKTHLKEEHNLTPEDLDDDQGIRVPKINSQGKVKVFKCKQCEFVAVTKEDFWRHSKMHIKPEKMLNCPKCPFVTEYKHHLEYHLRNHFGSKPFKCPNCSYTCVNKSMLNSHMKSHTNIYQYRCADCNYATKYCHSLKLHLRKYSHKPAMVLNSDGTPNPLPIIDVYGTRRGPKKKSDSEGGGDRPGAGLSMSPEGPPTMAPVPPKSPTSPGDPRLAAQAPRFPLLPPFVMAQMQMQMQQSLNQSASPTRIAQVPPFSRSGAEDYLSMSPVRRFNERGDSSELEDEERRSLTGGQNENSNGKSAAADKLKCRICDFETVSQDIFRNHMMLHATKDQDSPPPVPSQYPLQIRSPLAINAAAAAAFLRKDSAEHHHGPHHPQSGDGDMETPSSSSLVKQEAETSNKNDYLEYLKKMAPLLKQSISPAPLVSSTQTSSSPPVTSELISRLYFGNMVKSLSSTTPPAAASSATVPDSSGALDLSQLTKAEHHGRLRPSRPQSQAASSSGKSSSRRKVKPYKIERKLPSSSNTGADNQDRDSLNSGQSEYSTEQDPDLEVKSDGSTASTKEDKTTTGNNGTSGIAHERDPGMTHLSLDHDELAESKSKNLSGSHICKFCEIAFMDSIMFTIHMGYHGFQNPFKCNMCGEETTDKVGFFLHIARKAHQ